MAMYINPAVVNAAMQVLKEHKEQHPESKTPLFDVCKTSDEHTRIVFVRAAQRLKFNVVRTRGHVYENGLFLW